jgi:hypothetical protein
VINVPMLAGSRSRAFFEKRPRLVSASPGPPTLSWGLGARTAESELDSRREH